MNFLGTVCLFLSFCVCNIAAAQQDTVHQSTIVERTEVGSMPSNHRFYKKVTRQLTKTTEKIQKQNNKTLARLKKNEKTLYAALGKTDSIKAHTMYTEAISKREALEKKIKDPNAALKEITRGRYISRLDSLTGLLKYTKGLAANEAHVADADKALAAVNEVRTQYAQSTDLKALMEEQKASVKAAILRLGVDNIKQLPALQKAYSNYGRELHYYKERLAGWKAMLKDPQKMEEVALKLLKEVPAFKKYMQENGELAQLFGPRSGSTTVPSLQTRDDMNQQLQQRFGKAFVNEFIAGEGTLAKAQSELAKQKTAIAGIKTEYDKAKAQYKYATNKLEELQDSSKGSLKKAVKDSAENIAKAWREKLLAGLKLQDSKFVPNPQKTKLFAKRLEYGFNLQTDDKKGNWPATNNLAVNIGYKLSDRFVAGVAVAYKFGLGSNWKNIRYTHDGIGLRSFLDWKIKRPSQNTASLLGNWWLTGGYEVNYYARFKSMADLKQGQWVQSGLLGLSKKIKLPGYDKKGGFKAKEMKAQVLWDFLTYSAVPKGKAFLIRVGYNF